MEQQREYRKFHRFELHFLDAADEMMHEHSEPELIYVLEGMVQVRLGEQEITLQKEDVYLINTEQTHALQASGKSMFLQLHFTFSLVSDLFRDDNLYFLCDSTKADGTEFAVLRRQLQKMMAFYLRAKGQTNSFKYIAQGYEILDTLQNNFLCEAAREKKDKKYERTDLRMEQIRRYVKENYNQQISLRELAEAMYLSEGYLARFFRSQSGETFTEYLAKVRLRHAMDDLIHTDMPITKIIYANGFSNSPAFNKLFREEYGDTPSNFRKKQKMQVAKEADAEIRNMAGWEQKIAGYLLEERPQEEDVIPQNDVVEKIELSVTKYSNQKMRSFRMINIGMAEDLLRSEVREHLLLLKKLTNAEYVRFWNPFTPSMLFQAKQKSDDYNFSKIDQIFDFLVEHGLKPHLDLGVKPRLVQKTVDSGVTKTLEFRDDFDMEIDPEDWDRATKALMRHLARRYGSEIDSWRMELWYIEGKWNRIGTFPDYFAVFDLLYQNVRQVSDTLEVGGCGLKFDYLETMRQDFLSQWSKRKIRPDFISCVYFPYERAKLTEDPSFRRNTNSEYLTKCVNRIRSEMDAFGMQASKLYIAEWNNTLSDRNAVNDSCFRGAYVVKNLIDVCGKVDDMGIFLGTDCVSDYLDTGKLLYGGTGVITKHGIVKPAGHALYFMSRMFPYEISRGKHYMLTTNNNQSFTLVCHNEVMPNTEFYYVREDQVGNDNVDSFFDWGKTLHLEFTLQNLKAEEYSMLLYRINSSYGSILNLWQNIGFENDLSAQDINYLKGQANPQMQAVKLPVEQGCISMDFKMEANEILFAKIIRKN